MTRPRTRLREKSRQEIRRSRRILGRRFAFVGVLALALLAGPAQSAPADASSQIVTATVYTSSGTKPDSVNLGALQQGGCQQYSRTSMEELGRQGFVDVPLPSAGQETGTWSLSTVLNCMQTSVPPSAVNGVTVLRSDGSPEEDSGSLITRADLASTASDFSTSSEYPVIEDLGSATQYDRPWRGGSDLDYLDEVQESDGTQPAPIAIEVFEGPLLQVAINASRTSVPIGTTVGFSATVSPPGQSGLTYSWNFDGGATNSTAAAPQVTFSTAGTYDVTLQVTDAAGGGGGNTIQITAGSKPAAATGTHNQSGGGKNKNSHTPTGPVHSGGTSPGAPAGSSSGTQATGGSGHSAASSTSSTGTSSGHTNTTPSKGRSPAPLKLFPVPNVGPQAPLIAGRLVADVIPLSAAASPLVRSVPRAQGAAPPARQAIRASVLPAVAGALAVLIVFALGAARELGWRLMPRLPHLGS